MTAIRDIETSAAALYDGGWRASDIDQMMREYDMTRKDAEAIAAKLAEMSGDDDEPTVAWHCEVYKMHYYEIIITGGIARPNERWAVIDRDEPFDISIETAGFPENVREYFASDSDLMRDVEAKKAFIEIDSARYDPHKCSQEFVAEKDFTDREEMLDWAKEISDSIWKGDKHACVNFCSSDGDEYVDYHSPSDLLSMARESIA